MNTINMASRSPRLGDLNGKASNIASSPNRLLTRQYQGALLSPSAERPSHPVTFEGNWLERLKERYAQHKKRNNRIAIGAASTGVILSGLYFSDDPMLTGVALTLGLLIGHIGPIYFTHKGIYNKGLRHGKEALFDDAKTPSGMMTRTLQVMMTGLIARDTVINEVDDGVYNISPKHPDSAPKDLPSPQFFEQLEQALNQSIRENPDALKQLASVDIHPNYDDHSVQLVVHRPEGYEASTQEPERSDKPFKSFMFKWYPGLAKLFWADSITR